MPSYYNTKKPRCTTCSTEAGVQNWTPFFLTFATTSSLRSGKQSAETVYTVETTQDQNPNAVALKGSGNIKKHGSGGNSYASYIAKKKGEFFCPCS